MATKSGVPHDPSMLCTYGISAEEIAERTGVDVSTARRWKAGSTRIPHAAKLVLEADLGAFGKDWRGWRISGEELVSPEGWRIRRGEVLAVPLMNRQIAALQAERRAFLRIDPQPDTIDPAAALEAIKR